MLLSSYLLADDHISEQNNIMILLALLVSILFSGHGMPVVRHFSVRDTFIVGVFSIFPIRSDPLPEITYFQFISFSTTWQPST
jgi:hypothetical protein